MLKKNHKIASLAWNSLNYSRFQESVDEFPLLSQLFVCNKLVNRRVSLKIIIQHNHLLHSVQLENLLAQSQ